jgi:hypothetical protein
MNKFEVKKHNYSRKGFPLSIYLSISTDTVNPLELEKEIELIMEYLEEKYREPKKVKNFSLKEWLVNCIKTK